MADSELLRREAGANRAYRHRMAVRDGKIAAPFYSMAERVTEIELLTLSEVELIARNYIAFYLYAAAHDVFYIALDVAELENFKETFVRDYSVFYALRRAVRKEGVAQRIKAVGVAEHERRLVKCPGEIFALREIDTRLAAHGGIDRRQESGGYLNESHPAKISARREARYVADYSAAEGYEYGAAREI